MRLTKIADRMRYKANLMRIGERAAANIGRDAESRGFREIAKTYDECAEMVTEYQTQESAKPDELQSIREGLKMAEAKIEHDWAHSGVGAERACAKTCLEVLREETGPYMGEGEAQ